MYMYIYNMCKYHFINVYRTNVDSNVKSLFQQNGALYLADAVLLALRAVDMSLSSNGSDGCLSTSEQGLEATIRSVCEASVYICPLKYMYINSNIN